MKQPAGLLLFSLAVAAMFLLMAASSAARAEKPLRSWRRDEFERRGQIIQGPQGQIHDQFVLRNWIQPTLLDLSGSVFYANEKGPFDAKNLPREWPVGEALKVLPEAVLQEKYPISLRGKAAGIYVRGGSVVGVQPRELPWRMMKALYDGDGVRIECGGEIVVEGMCFDNVEDAVSPRGEGAWIARGIYARYVRDDFVENDALLSGEIDDCLVDGAHVLLSARPGKQADPEKVAERGHPPHVKIHRTLARISLMPWDGDMNLEDRRFMVDGKSGGKLFKWSPAAGTVDVTDCVFRLDGMSPTGPNGMRFPDGTYRNVTLIWLGGGVYPAPIPPGVTVLSDAALWETERRKWLDNHPAFLASTRD